MKVQRDRINLEIKELVPCHVLFSKLMTITRKKAREVQVTESKGKTIETTGYTFKEEHVPVSSDGLDRRFLDLEGLPIINGSYVSPNEVRNIALIIPFRDGAEKVREKQLYVFLHHTLQFLVQQNSSFTIILSNQSGKAFLVHKSLSTVNYSLRIEKKKFNRAKLLNIGFDWASKNTNASCFVLRKVLTSKLFFNFLGLWEPD